jgi:hypothetical protein
MIRMRPQPDKSLVMSLESMLGTRQLMKLQAHY